VKIAIGSDDKVTIRKKHFGESRFYIIYKVLHGKIHTSEIRENPNVCGGKHAHGQAEKITDLLHDCQIFMGGSMGAKSLKHIASKHIEIIITTGENAEDAVVAYLNSSDDENFKYYNADTNEFCNCNER
jgi:predicted Fe-Mo cluster-binding NifX family protein